MVFARLVYARFIPNVQAPECLLMVEVSARLGIKVFRHALAFVVRSCFVALNWQLTRSHYTS